MPTHIPHPTDPFRSPRLFYRAIHTPSDNSLFQAINDDRLGWQNSNVANIKLPSPKDAADFQQRVAENHLLGAIICLMPDATTESAEEMKSEKKEELGEGGREEARLAQKWGMPIGQVHLKNLPSSMVHHRFTEIGIDILPAYQGRGYGSEAINWVLDYAFRRAGLHRVAIKAFEWNVGAMRLYERLGFKVEGRDRETFWHEGRWWDGVSLGMLEREWWELQKGDGVALS